MEKQASNEYLAKTANGFVAVAMGVGLLLAAVVQLLRAAPLRLRLSGAAIALLWGAVFHAAPGLIVAMAVGPLLAWKRGDLYGAAQRLTVALAVAIIGMVAAGLAAARVNAPLGSREDVLPGPLFAGVRVFAFEGIG